MKFGVALFPSKELQDKVNSYRKRYDPHYAYIPPHITLKEKFEADSEDKEKIVEYLRKVAKEHQPTEIEIKKVSSFAPTSPVIYFKVEPNETLSSLHDALNQGDFYGENKHPFVPHFTLAQGTTSQEFEDTFSHLSMAGIQHKETVNKIALAYQLENGMWQVSETFRLGEG
jgi:2'-5' RNA ligase